MPRTMFTPGASLGTMIWVMRPLASPPPSGSSVRHMTMKKSARLPFEVNHLWPLMTHSSPSRRAVVLIDRGSEPAWSGSVMEKPDSNTPSMSGMSHLRFCSSVPYLTRIVWLPELGATTPNSDAAPIRRADPPRAPIRVRFALTQQCRLGCRPGSAPRRRLAEPSLSAPGQLGADVVHHRAVAHLGAEQDQLGVLLDAHAVSGRPVEHVSGGAAVEGAVGVGDDDITLDDVAPVRGGAGVVLESGKQGREVRSGTEAEVLGAHGPFGHAEVGELTGDGSWSLDPYRDVVLRDAHELSPRCESGWVRDAQTVRPLKAASRSMAVAESGGGVGSLNVSPSRMSSVNAPRANESTSPISASGSS